MPVASKRAKPKALQHYIAWRSFEAEPGVIVTAKTRLRGTDRIVKTFPHYFMPAASDDAELGDRYAEEAGAAAAELPQPLPDENAMVATRTVGVNGLVSNTTGRPWTVDDGEYVSGDHPAVREHHDAFVPVIPPGLKRRDALVALATCRAGQSDGTERVLHRGQWIRYDDPLVALHPHLFAPPAVDPEEENR